jgi:hypothetical protein
VEQVVQVAEAKVLEQVLLVEAVQQAMPQEQEKQEQPILAAAEAEAETLHLRLVDQADQVLLLFKNHK